MTILVRHANEVTINPSSVEGDDLCFAYYLLNLLLKICAAIHCHRQAVFRLYSLHNSCTSTHVGTRLRPVPIHNNSTTYGQVFWNPWNAGHVIEASATKHPIDKHKWCQR